jgi:phage shock protein A
MPDLPPDPRQKTEQRIRDIQAKQAQLTEELARAQEELRRLEENNKRPPARDQS